MLKKLFRSINKKGNKHLQKLIPFFKSFYHQRESLVDKKKPPNPPAPPPPSLTPNSPIAIFKDHGTFLAKDIKLKS